MSDSTVVTTVPKIEVAAPKSSFKDSADAVKLALESEMRVTKQINEIVDLAIKDKDHLAKNALEWFVNEQREEVSSMDTLLRMVKRADQQSKRGRCRMVS
mgnify:CR=1 FL=1